MEPEDVLLEAAEEAYRMLAEAEDALKSAGRWGWADLLGGGFIAGHLKHKRVDSVRSKLRRARRALQRVNEVGEELGLGVASTAGLDRKSDRGTRLVDLWVDDPFTDVAFHRKVKSMKSAVERSRRQLDRIVGRLDEGERG